MKSSHVLKCISLMLFLILAIGCGAKRATVQPAKPEPPAEAAKVSVIQRISYSEEDNYTRIQIEGSEPIAPPYYKVLTDPLRIAIDIPSVDLKEIKTPLKIENGTIGEVLATQYDDKGRIEIGLAQMANYNITKEEKSILIDVERAKKIAETKETKPEEAAKPEEPKKEMAQPKAKEIVNLLYEQKKDFVLFNVVADGRVENYDSFKLDSPARLVLDIWDVGRRYPKKSVKIKSPLIKQVRMGRHADKLRVVFDSAKPELPSYHINRVDNRLVVSFGKVPQPSEPQILLPEKVGEGPPPRVMAKAGRRGTVKEIDFKQIDNKSRIVVVMTEEPAFESQTVSKNKIAVDIKNAFVPKRLQRALNTSEFDSAVNYIDITNVKRGKVNDVRILILLREEVPFQTAREGKMLFIDFERPKKAEAKVAPPAPEKREEVIEAKKEPKEGGKEGEVTPTAEKLAAPAEEKAVPAPKVVQKAGEEKKGWEAGFPEKVYTGRKLSLDFKDADIKNILRLIAEVSNLNIIVGEDVTGKITMRLVDVPWDQALDVILQSKGLGMSRVGNVVRIAPVDTIKREIQSELEAKRAKERLEDLVTELIPVNYASGKEILPQVKSVLTERGDVKIDERTNILIIKDVAKKIADVKMLVKSLDTKTPQILIEARIVEANLTFQNELGVSWGFLLGGGKATAGGGLTGTTFLESSAGTQTHPVVDLPALARGGVAGTTGTSGIVEFLFRRGSIQELDIAISAHENKGDVKVISSPKIATLDNKEASIEQGLRIPYRKLTTEGTVTTDFIDANLKLTVTPHVTNDGHIKLNIKAKKDAPDQSIVVDGVPSIDKKEAITEVLVKDNGVVVIAGVYSITKNEGGEGIPLLNKIPLLGWLFKREIREDQRKDLLIFIAPKVLKDQV
jgi:type IV pilus assembly protein PilQ